MNPSEIEDDLNKLDLMLYGGSPARAAADFAHGEVGHLDSAKVRNPSVSPSPGQPKEPEFVLGKYVVSESGKVSIEGPGNG